MHILHVVHSLVPGEYRGGISKVVHELAAAQVRLGHRVEVFTTTLNSGVPTNIPDLHVAEFDGLRATSFAAHGKRGARGYAPSLKRRLLQEAGHYDVLHGHNPYTHLSRYLVASARQNDVPLFTHLHGALNPYGQRKWRTSLRNSMYLRFVERANLRANTGLFALSEHEAREAERQVGGGNTILLPNGTTLVGARQHAHPQRFRDNFGLGDRPILLFVGRICDIKGVHLLAEAFTRLAKDFNDLQLVIAGNRDQFPDYIGRVDDIIKEAQLAQRVTWTGFLNEQQKLDALAASDVFCHPSETEGMPMAVLEAMALELPCVIGKGCFMAEAARAGAVVECDFHSASVEHGVRQQFSDSVARRAGQHAAEFHNWDAIARRTLQHYGNADHQALKAA